MDQTGLLPHDPLPKALAEDLPEVEVAGNRLRLFAESPPLIRSLVDDIRSAKSRVWIESYTFAGDAAGRAVAAALEERAAAGVDCRLMYDAVGSYSTPRELFASLERAGVRVHAFHTLANVFWRVSWLRLFNRRNHRKLAVIDDRVAYFGGMNIVDQSVIATVEDAKARHLPASAGWRDVHVRLEGPQQTEVAAAFERLWQRMHHRRGPRRLKWRIRDMLSCRDDAIFFFDSRPQFKYRRPARVLVPLIRQAKASLTLSMAYFIPEGNVLRELLRARRRGVRVRVILPGDSDVLLAQWASRHLYDKLLRAGIHIYERTDQMLHSKVMVLDGVWSVVGSCNIDPRSLRLNLEFLAVIRSRAFAAEIERICDYEREHSQAVQITHRERHPWWRRQLDWAAWLLRRWL